MMSEPDQASTQRAIVIAQNATDDYLDQDVRIILRDSYTAIYRRITSSPNTYVLTPLEARVFNYHQSQWKENDLAKRAWARYWNNTHGTNGMNGR